ncbi:MAG: DUF4129 domain-containing protein [Planctomycetaceae bacterium]
MLVMRTGLLRAVWLILVLLCVAEPVCAGALVQPSADEYVPLTDEQIESAGQQVMEATEFRSLRRRVLEQVDLRERDTKESFLVRSLEWLGEKVRAGLSRVGDFFEWLWSGLWGRPGVRTGPTTSPTGTGEGWLSKLFNGDWDGAIAAMSGLVRLLVLVLVVMAVGLFSLLIAKLVRRRDQQRSLRGLFAGTAEDLLSDLQTPPGELPATTYEGRARQLAAEGNYRAAIRELLLGSMAWIERAGLIRYRRGLTNRDYVRSVWRRLQQRQAYLTTAGQFELVYFGRRPATAAMFEQCLGEFEGAFREEETQTAAV